MSPILVQCFPQSFLFLENVFFYSSNLSSLQLWFCTCLKLFHVTWFSFCPDSTPSEPGFNHHLTLFLNVLMWVHSGQLSHSATVEAFPVALWKEEIHRTTELTHNQTEIITYSHFSKYVFNQPGQDSPFYTGLFQTFICFELPLDCASLTASQFKQ